MYMCVCVCAVGVGGQCYRLIHLSLLVIQVRLVMISRMAKPEEVLVIETEQGEVVREFMKDTDAINMYKSMRETLGRLSISLYIHVWFPGVLTLYVDYACELLCGGKHVEKTWA